MENFILSQGQRLGLLCVVLLPFAPAWSQQTGETPLERTHTLDTVTVTTQQRPNKVTSTTPLQRMAKADIERMGALEVSDAVKHFSGVSVKDYGGIGGLKTISVRSLGAQHTAVSYDGVAVGDCQSGQVDISRFSLDNISELTMSIGQNDNIYQTAKMFASAGALSIETDRPKFGDDNFMMTAKLKAGSYGMVNPSLMLAQRLSNSVSLSAYGDFLRADGNYRFKMKNGNKLIDEKRNNSDIESYRAEVNLFAAISKKQDLKVKAYLYDSERGLPGSVVYDNPYSAERLYDRNYFGQVKYENRFSQKWKLMASGKFNYSWNRDYDRQSSGVTDYRYRQRETYLSATLWTQPVKGLSFSLANDFAYNDLSTTLPECQYPERFTLLTVIASHYENSHISATASLLNTFISENVEVGTAAADRKRLSPSVSLSWKPLDDRSWRVRISYQDIFRTPTFNDLYYLLIGNSKLRPEKTKQVNLGTTWSASLSSLVDYISLSVDGYYGSVRDKILAIPTMFVWRMSNAGKVETLGTDVNLASELAFNSDYRLFVTATYNFIHSVDISDKASKIYRHQIPYTPKHSGSASVTLKNPYVDFTYNVTYASERYRIAQNAPENRIKPYCDHGISLSRKFKLGEHSLRVQADALNLGGKNYEIIRFYPMAGRNYKIALTYQF